MVVTAEAITDTVMSSNFLNTLYMSVYAHLKGDKKSRVTANKSCRISKHIQIARSTCASSLDSLTQLQFPSYLHMTYTWMQAFSVATDLSSINSSADRRTHKHKN